MDFRELTGYRLSDVINILKSKGVKFYLKKTGPPPYLRDMKVRKEKRYHPQNYRIVRQKIDENNVIEFIIAEE